MARRLLRATHAGRPKNNRETGSGPLQLHRRRHLVWILFAAFCAVWFYTLGARTLIPTDEGRYAEIAREMAASGDFITLRLNGIPYFGKPPLQIWMTALSFHAFGLGEWQARLWTGLSGIAGIMMVAYAGRRVFGERAGLTAGLILASCLYWATAGHVNSVDMSLAAMMTLALCALLISQDIEPGLRAQRNWMLVCWVGMALAVLSKGLVGIVLPGAVLVLYTLISRDWAIWRRLHFWPGLPVFFLIAAPWFVLVSLRTPEFLPFFFLREHFARFASNVHNRHAPWHYFIPFLLAGILPWLGVLVQSLWDAHNEKAHGFQPQKLLLVWAVFIFCFFSISKAKLPSYILPVFPSLALLIAVYLETASYKTVAAAAAIPALIGASGLILLPRVTALAADPAELILYRSYVPWLAAAGVIALTGSILAIALARRRREWALLSLAAGGFLAGQAMWLGHEPFGAEKSGVRYVPQIASELAAQTPIYAVGLYEYVLPFYLQRTTTQVAFAADGMELGLKLEPHLWIPRLDSFIEKWMNKHRSGQKALAILHPDMFAELRRRGVPMRVLVQDRRRVIVASE